MAEVVLSPGDDLNAAAQTYAEGTHFRLRPGIYVQQTVRPRDGQVWAGTLGPNGERLTVLTGARRLSSWTRDGDRWFADGQTQDRGAHGACVSESPLCGHPEDVYIDNQLLQQVGSLGEVNAGTFYFDYGADRIWIGTDPGGRVIETTLTDRAIIGPADDVVVRDLVVEKYANHAQHGAIDAQFHNDRTTSPRGLRWLVENVEARYNHGAGIRLNDFGTARNSFVHHNGQLGIAGNGARIKVLANDIAWNNTTGFTVNWEAGGTKFAYTSALEVAYNHVHDNYGPGIWTDIDNQDAHHHHNLVANNDKIGIYHEISFDALIEYNTVVGNGFGFDVWGWGAGILVAASSGVEVRYNKVLDNADGIIAIQQARGSGPRGKYEVRDLWVHENCVRQSKGWAAGALQDIADLSIFNALGNRFENNTYDVPDAGPNFFVWNNGERRQGSWISYHPSDAIIGAACSFAPGPEMLFFDSFESGFRGWSSALGRRSATW